MLDAPILVLAGSARTPRRSPAIAGWIAGIGRALDGGRRFEVVEVADLGLGLGDEPGLPAKGAPYTQATTHAWGERVKAAAAVVFVTPQYNWGYPAPLKNAIDHLYAEWKSKPVLLVTYGGHGGDRCEAQLRVVMTGVGAQVVEAAPGLRLARARIEADDGAVDPDVDFAEQRGEVEAALRELIGQAAGATA